MATVNDLAADDIMIHLNREVTRLSGELRDQATRYELLLRAEREYSRRLSAAGGLYRSAAMVGWAILDPDERQGELDEIDVLLKKADAVVLPSAGEG